MSYGIGSHRLLGLPALVATPSSARDAAVAGGPPGVQGDRRRAGTAGPADGDRTAGGTAERDSDTDKVRRHPRLAWASAKLAAAVEVLFEVNEYGTEITLEQLWEGIER
jgi:hypothetical protein